MAKPVAKVGQVTASEGKGMYGAATSGSWTKGEIKPTSYPKLSIGGKEVLHEATCKFSFSGKTDSSPPVTVTGTSDVTLSAKTTKLQKGASNVLRDGDSAEDSYGNKLEVSAQNVLKSA